MSITFREYPVISGENAKRFLQREAENKDKIKSRLEKLEKSNSQNYTERQTSRIKPSYLPKG